MDVTTTNMDTQNASKPKKNMSKKTMIASLVVILVFAGAGYFGYRYMQAKKEITRLSNPTEAARQEAQALTDKVSSIVQLPTNETPTIATVSDASKLQSQPFFANAQNGDKVLIFTQAKKAIMYRPSTNKVIEIATINIDKSTQSTPTPATTKKP